MAGRRRRGFGSIRKLPSGRVQASYTGPDRARHSAPVTFSTILDAEAWLASEHRLWELEEWTSPSDRHSAKIATQERDSLTLSAFVKNVWLPSLELRPSTARDYDSLLRNHITPAFGDTPLVLISTGQARMWWAQMDPSKPRARAKAFQLLHNIMGSAVDLELIPSNPATLSKTVRRDKRTGKSNKRIEPLTIPQLYTIADSMPPRLRLAVLLACFCSLRYGELTELRKSDVFFDKNTLAPEIREKGMTVPVLHVSRAVIKVKGGYLPGEPKTAAGKRWVHIPPSLSDELKAHIQAHAGWGPDGLIFPATNGGHMHSNTFARFFAIAAAKANRPDATPHLLRHTGVSLARKAGATTRVNMDRSGHSTPAMSLHYEHSFAGDDAELAKKIDALLPPAKKPDPDGGSAEPPN